MEADKDNTKTPVERRAEPALESASGAIVTADDGRQYIDYDCREGAVILGHANEQVVTALTKAARRGLATLSDSRRRERFAALVQGAFEGVERIAFAESGLAALRASVQAVRSATGRWRIVSCGCGPVNEADQGCFNDLESIRREIDSGDEAPAAIYVAPVRTCDGVIRPAEGFLQGVRELADRAGARLVFDERVTAFRLGFGGAQHIFDIRPDVTVLGGVIGGGLPLGAILCDAETESCIDDRLLPANQLAMACGQATLEPLRDGAIYGRLEALGASLAEALGKAMPDATIRRSGSMLTLGFAEDPAENARLYGRFRDQALDEGILAPVDPFQPWFLTAEHGEKDIRRTAEAATAAFQRSQN